MIKNPDAGGERLPRGSASSSCQRRERDAGDVSHGAAASSRFASSLRRAVQKVGSCSLLINRGDGLRPFDLEEEVLCTVLGLMKSELAILTSHQRPNKAAATGERMRAVEIASGAELPRLPPPL